MEGSARCFHTGPVEKTQTKTKTKTHTKTRISNIRSGGTSSGNGRTGLRSKTSAAKLGYGRSEQVNVISRSIPSSDDERGSASNLVALKVRVGAASEQLSHRFRL